MFLKKINRKKGLSPGSLVYVGDREPDHVSLSYMEYNQEQCLETLDASVEDCLSLTDKSTVGWVHVRGVHDVEVVRRLGEAFHLHPLLLEDLVNTEQRPKVEEYPDCLFLVFRGPRHPGQNLSQDDEQISVILGDSWVISLQERHKDVFAALRERIAKGKGRIRRSGADYLAYALVDLVMDEYFNVLESLGGELEALEERVLTNPGRDALEKILALQKELAFLRRSTWPLRDSLSRMERGEFLLLGQDVKLYLRDAHDHAQRIAETVETYRDMLSGILNIYLSNSSNRMNEVMKVLTIIATIFIPMTFLAGIYGMNFRHMPELDWPWAYPLFWGVALTVATGMVAWFKKNNWF